MKTTFKILLSTILLTLTIGCGDSSNTNNPTVDPLGNMGGGTGGNTGGSTGGNTGGNPATAGVSEVDGGEVFLEIMKSVQYYRSEAKETVLIAPAFYDQDVTFDHSDGNRTRTTVLNSFGYSKTTYNYFNYDDNDEGTTYNGTAKIEAPYGDVVYFDTNITATGEFAHEEQLFGSSPDRNTALINVYGEIKMGNIVMDDIAMEISTVDRNWTITSGRFYVYKVDDTGALETSPFYCELLSGLTSPIEFDSSGNVSLIDIGCNDADGNEVYFKYFK